MDSPNAFGGRGLARGEFFARDGSLIATTAQEGLIRVGDAGAG
jgi:acyl-CoA thioesterase-2